MSTTNPRNQRISTTNPRNQRIKHNMTHKIKFSVTRPFGDRIHYITAEDITVVLSRIPEELWHRLREVHFNDQSRGVNRLGYVNQGRKEITLCALPPRIRLKDNRQGLMVQNAAVNGLISRFAASCSMVLSFTNWVIFKSLMKTKKRRVGNLQWIALLMTSRFGGVKHYGQSTFLIMLLCIIGLLKKNLRC